MDYLLTHIIHSDHLADLRIDGSISLPSIELLQQVAVGRDLREFFAPLSVAPYQATVLGSV